MMSWTWSPWPALTTASQATVIETQFLPEPLWQSVTFVCAGGSRVAAGALSALSLQPSASRATFAGVRFCPP